MNSQDFVLEENAPPARNRLAREVQDELSRAESDGQWQIVRLAAPVDDVDPLAWLAAQPYPEKGYWSGRDDETTCAYAGTADVQTGAPQAVLTQLQNQLTLSQAKKKSVPRYYGGLRFDETTASDDGWSPFGPCRFVLPRFELWARPEQTTLHVTLVLPRDRSRSDELLDAIERMTFPERAAFSALPLPVSRTDAPDAEQWTTMIRRALDDLEEPLLDKVVLARRSAFHFEEPLLPLPLLRTLQTETPGCFHFYLQPHHRTAFLGASPERLFRHQDRAFRSEAVAGTRPRSDDPAEDARLRGELLSSAKDRREHDFVRRHLSRNLTPLCTTLTVEKEPSEMKLKRGRHLCSLLHGTLSAEVSTTDLLSALHPTPAVGGSPRPKALRRIRRLEPFDRGWYAGPVGWIAPNSAEFAVAIRSGLIQDRRLALFSGAGIVQGSQPQSEWREIEQKITDFTDVLGLASA